MSIKEKLPPVAEVKLMIEQLTGRPIAYRDYSKDATAVQIGREIERVVENVQSKIPSENALDIASYSPFIIDENTPSWQVFLWQPFLDFNGGLTYEKFKNKRFLIEKPRQIGYSYSMFRLMAALSLMTPQSFCVFGTKDKTWIQEIITPIAESVLPYLNTTIREKNALLDSLGFAPQELVYNKATLEYKFPLGNLIKLMGVDSMNDKSRGKGNVNLIGFDEAAYIEKSNLITQVFKPMLDMAQGSFIFGSTPNGPNWFKSYSEEAEGDDTGKYLFLGFDLYESGVHSEERCDQILMDALSDHLMLDPTLTVEESVELVAVEYFRYYSGKTDKTKFFPRFSEKPENYVYPVHNLCYGANCDPDNNAGLSFDIYAGIDYGGAVDPAAVEFAALSAYGQIFYFDEIYMYNVGVEEIVGEILERQQKWGVEIKVAFIDRSVEQKHYRQSKNETKTVLQLFQSNGLNQVYPASYMRKQNRLDIMNEFLVPVVGEGFYNPVDPKSDAASRIYIGDNCSQLIKQMQALEAKTKTEAGMKKVFTSGQMAKMKNDHAVDAALYVLSEISGYKAVSITRKNYHKIQENSIMRLNDLIKPYRPISTNGKTKIYKQPLIY